jgi:hypothetical protein
MKEIIKVGDELMIEQAWEDEAGYFHDQQATVSRIRQDGTLQFRIGHWKTRTAQEEKIQAFMNGCEWYAKDVEKL